jgi:hypothetical protein
MTTSNAAFCLLNHHVEPYHHKIGTHVLLTQILRMKFQNLIKSIL